MSGGKGRVAEVERQVRSKASLKGRSRMLMGRLEDAKGGWGEDKMGIHEVGFWGRLWKGCVQEVGFEVRHRHGVVGMWLRWRNSDCHWKCVASNGVETDWR